MARLPNGVTFVVETKNQNQAKWQLDEEFQVDAINGPQESEAQEAAFAAFTAALAAYAGGQREYRVMKCIGLSYEERPL